jgi:hypothetical protein
MVFAGCRDVNKWFKQDQQETRSQGKGENSDLYSKFRKLHTWAVVISVDYRRRVEGSQA